MAAIDFRFVGPGSLAPQPLPPGEIWVDVGGRFDRGVLDHHGGDAAAGSATRLVQRHAESHVRPALAGRDAITLVLHNAPDLDAIAAAWLVRGLAEHGRLPEPAFARDAMIDAVDLRDQGFAVADPADDWPTLFYAQMCVHHADRFGDAVRLGFELLDRSLAALAAAGGDWRAAVRALRDPPVAGFLAEAAAAYAADRAAGTIFLAHLPGGSGPVDALAVANPTCRLFKDFARHDRVGSRRGRGFGFLVVSYTLHPARRTMWHHIVSVDPATGRRLDGLGARLERAERALEDAAGAPLFGGRERVPPGTGRHGADVASPWYDGRAHGHTIVDSPLIEIDGRPYCASQLPPERVLAIVREMYAAEAPE